MHTAPSTNAPAEAPWQRWRRTGDGDAFAALVQRHGPMVAAVCRRRLGDGADADDAFQAVFLLLLRRGHGIRDPERVGPWLHTCAVRACAQVRRTARRRARHEGAVPPPTPAEPSTDWSAVRGHLDDAIAGLTAAQRSAVVGFYLEGRAQADLAAAAGCSVAAVKMRLQAGLAALRQALARRGVGLPAPALVAGLAQERSALAGHPPGVDPGAVAPGRIAEAIIAADRLRWAAGIAAAVAGCGLAGGAWLWAAGSSVAPPRSPVPSPAPAVAADPPPPAPRAEDPWLRPDRQAVAAIGATADLRTLGLTARPFTLAADPEAAPALGRMWGELRRWNDLYRRRGGEDGVPFMALVESAQGLTAQALAPAPGQRQQPMLLTIAPGSALADLAAYRWEAATDTVVAGHRGWEQGAFTAIATDRHWLLGERSAVTAALGRAHDRQPAPPDAPLWIRYRQPDAAPDSPPAVLLTSRPEPDGIRSRMVLADTAPAPRIDGVALGAWSLRTWQDLPWRAPRPGRLRAAGDHDAVLAAGLDLTAPRAERIAAAVAGILGRPLTELLDGDVLVEADWPAGPLPRLRVVLGLKAGAAVRAAAALDARGGAVQTPIGALSARCDGDLLILADDPERLAAVGTVAPLPDGASLVLRLDLPRIGRTWLPALVALAGRRRVLEPGPWFWLPVMAEWARFRATGDHGGRPAGLLGGAPWDRILGMLATPGGDAVDLDRSLAVYGRPDPADAGSVRCAILVRTGDGFMVIDPEADAAAATGGRAGAVVRVGTAREASTWDVDGERRRWRCPPADLERRLSGWTRIAGPAPAALAEIVVPEPVVADARWIPPVAAILRHLPARHTVVLTAEPGRVVVEESGLPLLPVLAAAQWVMLSPPAAPVPAVP